MTEREKELADKYRDRAVERREEQKSFDIAAYNQVHLQLKLLICSSESIFKKVALLYNLLRF